MSSKCDKLALQKLKDVHFKKYGVPLGKRRCKMNLSENCLEIADESKFRGHQCSVCVSLDQRERHTARLAAQGLTRVGRGRKKEIQESDSESD